ncbi:MAG: glyoxylase family protein [Abditibacteriota bacterium]|nr:glyoxylase family protein [Abditibacteriota bacterium]
MKMEHIAYAVHDPVAVAGWYVEHLGLHIARQIGPPTFTHFLSDGAGGIIEIYNNAQVTVPEYAMMHPLLLHVAFATDDVYATRQRLLDADCRAEGEVTEMPNGDMMVMLRDPWGFAIQLVKRATALR